MITNASIDSMSVITNDSVWMTRREWRLRTLFRRNHARRLMEANRSRLHRPDSSHSSSSTRRKCFGANLEPAIFLYSFAAGILIPISSLFLFYARCVEILNEETAELGLDSSNVSEVCMNLDRLNDTRLMDQVEADVTQWRIYTQIVATITVVISSPIMGAWADYSGRRNPIIVCAFGGVIYVFLQFLDTFMIAKMNVFYLWIASELSCGMVGGLSTLMSQSFAVVSDDARADHSFHSDSVPLRITIASAVQAFGNLMGSMSVSAIEGLEYKTAADKVFAYQLCFGMSLFTICLAFSYMIFFMRDSYKEVIDRNEGLLVINEEVDENGVLREESPRTFSPFNSIKGLLEVACMKREGYLRFCLNFIVASIFVEMMLFDTQITCLFVKRPPFEWSDATFSNFFLMRFIFLTSGMALLPFIIRQMSFLGRELYMVIFGIGSNVAINMIMAFAKNSRQLLWTVPLSFPAGAIAPGFRILLPKLVPQQQTSRMFSMVTWVMVVGPMFSALIFNNVYKATMASWPGFVFFLQGVLCAGVVVGLCIVHYLLRPLWQRDTILLDQDLLLPVDDDILDEDQGIVFNPECERSLSVTAVNSEEEDSAERARPVINSI
ncbi:unnamed protein product [Bursaphelenchus xylophilus]|uniref:(pine wood nematode) hypothetical protein n=1 Tax=Bursaphelenchus xylophilus TaxID=6326 RepID=A0A1I7RMU5_BURXY|nr:unnamed protein product [Bursaphelenchus xylophilus]CAG9125458.1 unnamed protein product [Bursaphelenchus xylophilus]